MSRSDDLARRAAELAARAQQVAEQAREAGDIDDELARLEAELAALDEEQARLDRELGDVVDPPEEEEPVGDPEDAFTFRLGSLGDRIADLVNVAISSVGRFGASDVIDRVVEVTDLLPLTVDCFAGSITVLTGAHGRVEVIAERRALSDADLADIDVAITTEADGVHVRARSSSARRHRQWVKLTVTVPPGTPTKLRTRGGSIRVDGTGAEVDAQTSGGSIKTSGTRGAAELETAGGSIRADDHAGPLRAETMGGSIRAGGHLLAVDARTIGGSIAVEGAHGPVAAATKGGSVSVAGRLSGSCSLETAGGSIRIGVADGTNIEVEAMSQSITSDFEGTPRRGGLDVTIGTGADGRLVARAVAGSLSIRRA